VKHFQEKVAVISADGASSNRKVQSLSALSASGEMKPRSQKRDLGRPPDFQMSWFRAS
jgi:hypothetical protein